MDDALLARNLEAMAASLGQGPRPGSGSGRVRVEARAAAPTLLVRTDRDAWMSIHGSRDPFRDAVHQLDAALAGRAMPPVVAVIGSGLGYLLDAIESRAEATRVLVIEPDEALVAAAFGRKDWSGWFASGRLSLVWGPGYAGAVDAWRMLEDLDAGAEPLTLVNAALARAWPADVEQARACLRRIVQHQRANADARRRFAGPYLLNTLANLPVIARSGDVAALSGLFAGVPAVLVAAGPSLDDNLVELWDARERALVISTDTALRPLLLAGIEPHLVVAVDPAEINARHLTNLPPCPATRLVGEGSLHPAAFEHFAGREFIFQVSDHQPWPWLRGLGITRGALGAWGSVLTSAFDLALRMGCDPIVFIGADLAFTLGRPYARGTVFEEDWARRRLRGESLEQIWAAHLASRALVSVEGVDGAPEVTTSDFLAFRDWLLDRMRRHHRRFVNATGAGTLVGDPIVQASLAASLGASASPRAAGWRRAIAGAHAASAAAPDAMARALAERLDVPEATLVEWQRFAAGTITTDEIGRLLERAGRLLGEERPAPTAGAATSGRAASARDWPPVPGPTRADEVLRRFLTAGGPVPSAAPGLPTLDGSHAARQASEVRSAVSALGAIARRPLSPVVAPLLPSARPAASPARLPLADQFIVSGAAAPAVERLQFALATMLAEAGELSPRPPGSLLAAEVEALETLARRRFWSEAAGCGGRLADLATLSVFAQWAAVQRAVARGEPDPLDAWLEALLREGAAALMLAGGPGPGVGSAGLGSATLDITVRLATAGASARWRPERPIELPFPARLLTGAVRRRARPPDGDVRAEGGSLRDRRHRTGWTLTRRGGAFERHNRPDAAVRLRIAPPHSDGPLDDVPHPLAAGRGEVASWLEPVVLNDAGIPRCQSAANLDDDRAVVTPISGRFSLLVRADGRLEARQPWPHDITCEQPIEGGRLLAWLHAETSRLSVREGAGGPVRSRALRFRPTAVVARADGRFLCSSTDGLWLVGLDEAGDRQLAAIGPCVIVGEAGSLVRIDPVAMQGGALARRRLERGWTFDQGVERLASTDLGPEGQSWMIAERRGWRAQTFPDADLVVVTSPEGTVSNLVVSHPRAAAWAGTSLVVATTRGEVLLFAGAVNALA